MYGIMHFSLCDNEKKLLCSSKQIDLPIKHVDIIIYKEKRLLVNGFDIYVTKQKKVKIIDVSMYYNLKSIKYKIDSSHMFNIKIVNNIISNIGALRNLEELTIQHCTIIRGLYNLKKIKRITFVYSNYLFFTCCAYYYSEIKKLLSINKDVNIIVEKCENSLSSMRMGCIKNLNYKINHIFIKTTKRNFVDELKKSIFF